LVGFIGTVNASLELAITDSRFVAGQLRMDSGPEYVELLGLLDASGVLTLELPHSTVDVPSPEHECVVPVQLIPPLVGRFDGNSFSGVAVGEEPERFGDDAGISSFRFVTKPWTSSRLEGDDADRRRRRSVSFAVLAAKAAYFQALAEAKRSPAAGSSDDRPGSSSGNR